MRLSNATLDRLPRAIARPGYDRAVQRRGIVHLGIGAFHRAHQAVYTDAAMAAGDRDWAITGVSLRSARVHDTLAPQDGLYTVTQRSDCEERARVIGAVRETLVAPNDPAAVTAAIASPDTHVVTLTVTEKGYHLRSDGTLDLASADTATATIYDHLTRAFHARRNAGLPGLTLLSCDNLSGNGRALQAALTRFLDREAPALRRWFENECACPSTMVDRIVPAMTDQRLDDVAATLGLTDAAAVVTEPFRQWVIEDRFAGPRPRWDAGGAQYVAEVEPFETAKLRLLNGAHSAMAYLGLAAGLSHVHEAIADPAIRPIVERLMRHEAAPTIAPAPDQALSIYIDTLIDRFANPALPHRLLQIAGDGSQKIGPRWLEPLAINRAQGRRSPATLRALAAWIVFVRGDRHHVDDPLARELAGRWREAGASGIVDALFGPAGLTPATAALDEADREAVRQALAAVLPA